MSKPSFAFNAFRNVLLGATAACLAAAPFDAARAQQQTPWSHDDCWAFLPGEDPYTDKAMFSLRSLLDKTAGEKGYIKVNANGDFTRGDGTPIRFWATGSGVFEQDKVDMAKMEAHAKHLAKRGINLVRLFKSTMHDSKSGAPFSKPSDKYIDQFQMGVTALKKQGIYSLLTIYWNSDAGLFTDTERQAAYKNWWRELLTRPNPHDPKKTPLKDDPAIAILQIQNEASMFWWNSQDLHQPGRQAEFDKLNAEFKAWLAKNKLPENAELNYRFWNINDGNKAHAQEASQNHKLTMRFTAEKMRAFHAEIQKFLRDEIKCKALVNAGNWQTADQVRLLDHERWTYDANDVIALNRYVDLAGHHNPHGNVGWLVQAGDTFRNESCLRGDGWRNLPTNAKQIKGKPMLVTETGWVSPNLYQAEAPFLLSAYMSLNGVDACFWLGIGSVGYDVASWPWIPGMYKWGNHASPQVMGGWPATAWMFHKGYLKRGGVAVDEKRAFDGDLWELKVPVITEDTGFDPNQPGTKRAQSNIVGGVTPAAFLMGQVLIEYGKDPAGTKVNLFGNNPTDYNRGVIKASTGEILMDTARGICIISAPCAQGVVGFLKEAGPVKTAAMEIDMQNEYAAVLAVSLDNQPLTSSRKVLLQITTQSRPDGWADAPSTHNGKDVLRINNTGGGIHNAGQNHWNVKNTRGTVTFRGFVSRATLVDANFYPLPDKVPVERKGGSLVIKLPPNAMYVVLQ